MHPDLAKPEKKQLCSILDCQKLSPEVRAHAVRNERLPLRTVVQVLFFEQERGSGSTSRKPPLVTGDQENLSKSKVSPDEKSRETQEGTTRTRMPNVTERSRSRATDSEVKLLVEPEQNLSRKELEQIREKGAEQKNKQREKGRMTVGEEGISGSKFEFPSSSNKVMAQRRTNSKGRSSR